MKYMICRRVPLGAIRTRDRTVGKKCLNPQHEAGDVQALDFEFLDVGQCRKLTQDTRVEALCGEPIISRMDPELIDQRK